MTPRHLFQVLTLSLTTLFTSNTNAQHLGLSGYTGLDKHYGAPRTVRAAVGGFHSQQLHQSIALRTTLLMTYCEPWISPTSPQRDPTVGITLQLAPTLVPRPGVFIRAGAEAFKAFGSARTTEGSTSEGRSLEVHGLVAGGIQRSKWELGIQLTLRKPSTEALAPLYGTHLTVAHLIHSGSRRFAADRRWRKPLLPWQQPRWADRSREWRAF